MNKLAAALILSMLSGDVLAAHAQPATQTVDQVPPSADQLRASVPEIKKAILAATGNDDDTVELVATDMDFVVTLLDSKLASGSSTARESEASKIASVIADAISGKEEFKGILAIHVDYATRKAEGSSPRTWTRSISAETRRVSLCITQASSGSRPSVVRTNQKPVEPSP